jgi:hypothetical protein
MKTLTNYINNITKTTQQNYGVYPDTIEWTFYGDGEGDFETISTTIPNKQLLTEYAKYLKMQYSHVRELLNSIEEN